MRMPNMMDYALHYHKQGFWVVPISPTGKNPALSSWEKYTKNRPTDEDLLRWWSENPNYKIGFVTGRNTGICVLDIDDASKFDYYASVFPSGLVAKSGGGGYHIYYAYPPGLNDHLPNRFPEEGMHFRGDNGIIVAPPSYHSSGGTYEWLELGTPAVLPEGLLNVILAKGHQNGKIQSHEQQNWVRDLLENGSQPGTRNNDGTRLAGYFIGKGLPDDIVLQLMQPWYERTDKTDFPTSTLQTIISSVRNTDIRNAPLSINKETLPSHVQGFSSFISGDDEELTWTIADWFPAATTALMVAPPGTYKTWIMLAMAMAISTGQRLFDKYEIVKPGPVLVIQQEDSRDILKQRMRTIYSQMCADAGIEFHIRKDSEGNISDIEINNVPNPDMDVYTSPMLLRFADKESMRLLELLIDTRGYKVVFIDPLYMSADAENYMSKAAQEMSVLKQLRDRYGVSFMVLHHTKKSTTGETSDRTDAWGSQFINAWLETGFQIRPGENSETVKLYRHYKGTKAKLQEQIRFTIDTSPEKRSFKAEVIVDEAAVIQSGSDEDGQGQNILALLGEKSLNTQELADLTGVHITTIRRRLRKLTEKQLIRKNDDGTYSLP